MLRAGPRKDPGGFRRPGSLPSHPELLDYLAVEYRQSGWDTRAMPKDRRPPPTGRIPAPMKHCGTGIRKTRPRAPGTGFPPSRSKGSRPGEFRAVGGRRLDGPSAKPYQPDGSGEVSSASYTSDTGDGLYLAAVCTPSSSAPCRRPRSWHSTRRTGEVRVMRRETTRPHAGARAPERPCSTSRPRVLAAGCTRFTRIPKTRSARCSGASPAAFPMPWSWRSSRAPSRSRKPSSRRNRTAQKPTSAPARSPPRRRRPGPPGAPLAVAQAIMNHEEFQVKQ